MLLIKYMLLGVCLALWCAAASLVVNYLRRRYWTRGTDASAPELHACDWRMPARLFGLGWMPLFLAMMIVIVPTGHAAVRVSQLSGTKSGTLYPGVHFIVPFIENIETFDVRDKLFTTATARPIKQKPTEQSTSNEVLTVQAKEGLSIGLAITVRYRLDPARLDYIQSHLPQPVDTELVPAVVASAWRELVPTYTVREVFSSKREEVRARAAEMISRKLTSDGIVVKEVMLRDIQLPQEYAKGLETLLLKEQENDQLGVQTEIAQKNVRISELQAEAKKAEEVKEAEGQAQVKVLEAKGQSDAMQYLLPLKQKQIEQTRLEAEARKESTIKGAEAAAQAKVIDSKAEMERRKLLAEAEAQRIRVTAAADAERMNSEAIALKKNPLLINKIVAERLSDKIQVMMVPSDGKFFFANDALRGMNASQVRAAEEEAEDPPQVAGQSAGSHR